MRRASAEVWSLLQPVIEAMGYEFVGAQLGQAENGMTLRVYIDNAEGINLDDCSAVSRQVSAALDVDDLIDGAYMLEVSSPGLDRPLFTLAQYKQHVGQTVNIKLRELVSGRRRFTGLLTAVEEDLALVEIDGTVYDLPMDKIESARLESTV